MLRYVKPTLTVFLLKKSEILRPPRLAAQQLQLRVHQLCANHLSRIIPVGHSLSLAQKALLGYLDNYITIQYKPFLSEAKR